MGNLLKFSTELSKEVFPNPPKFPPDWQLYTAYNIPPEQKELFYKTYKCHKREYIKAYEKNELEACIKGTIAKYCDPEEMIPTELDPELVYRTVAQNELLKKVELDLKHQLDGITKKLADLQKERLIFNQSLVKEQEKENELNKKEEEFNSQKSIIEQNCAIIVEQDKSKIEKLFPDLSEAKIKEKQIYLQKTNSIKVQLLLIDIGYGKVPAFVLNKQAANKYGLVHSIVKIGIWTFDWDRLSLIEAEQLTATDRRNELFAIDVGTICVYDFLNTYLAKILQLISEWNLQKKYDVIECNCQKFSNTLISTLDLKEKFDEVITGNLAMYMQEIHDFGPQELWFPLKNGDKKTFKTHADLDDFEEIFFKKYPTKLDTKDPDYLLLKSFDRVFWHKFYEPNQTIEQLAPNKNKYTCKFKDTIAPGNTDEVALSMIK